MINQLKGISKLTIKHKDGLIVIVAYTLLTLSLTYPVIFNLRDALAGFEGQDNLQWFWLIWWFKHSILKLQSSFVNISILYYPEGAHQAILATMAYIPMVALPITLIGGLALAYNLSFLLSFILSGYTTYLMVKYLTGHRLAAFVGGLIFAFFPARFGHATGTFLGQITTYMIPIYILALLLLFKRPSFRLAMLTGVSLALLMITWSMHVAYTAAPFTIIYLVSALFNSNQRACFRRAFTNLIMAAGICAAIIAPFYWPLLQNASQGNLGYIESKGLLNFATDLLGFIAPSPSHPLLKPLGLIPDYATEIMPEYDNIQESLAYIGVVPTLLATIGIIKYHRKLYSWVLLGIGAAIFSLGPLLQVQGRLYQLNVEGQAGYLALPYSLVMSLPILNWGRTTGRLNSTVLLAIAVMAAFGVVYLWQFFRVKQAIWSVTGLLMIIILIEFLTIFPFPIENHKIPAFYQKLDNYEQAGAIIDLPISGPPSNSHYSLFYQTAHQQPLAGGYFLRKPLGTVERGRFLELLVSPPMAQTILEEPDMAAKVGLLNALSVRRVIVRSWLLNSEEVPMYLNHLDFLLGGGQRVGEGLFNYDVPLSGQPLPITSLLSRQGWQPTAENFLLLSKAGQMFSYIHSEIAQQAQLQVSLFTEADPHYVSVSLNSQDIAGLYVTQESLHYSIPVTLQPGLNFFDWYPEKGCEIDCAPVTFGQIRLEPQPGPPMPNAKYVFGENVSLLNYELITPEISGGNPVLLYLYWQGQNKMVANYSAFVHLVDTSGKIIAQNDYQLGGWDYPTAGWPVNYILAAPSLFFVPPDLSPGEYTVRVGLYDTNTGFRLPTVTDGSLIDTIPLMTITVRS